MGQTLCPSATSHTQLDPELIHEQFMKYKLAPYQYLLGHLNQMFPQSKAQDFLKSISAHYNAVPYHNISHAFDVMITCDKLLLQYKMKDQLKVDHQERVFILLAAYAHDNGHQGLTNNFYINSEDQLAITHLNVSPLEKLHSSNLLQALKLHNIPVSETHKKLMVSLILATDNKHHFEMIHKLQEYQQYLNTKVVDSLPDSKLELQQNPKKEIEPLKYKQTLLEMIIHTADLSPCGKPMPEYMKWNQRLYDEFKTEYRKERQLKLKQFSFHFDLKNEEFSLANENLNFFNKMILPFFKEVSAIVPQFSYELNNAIKIRNHFQQKARSLEIKKASTRQLQESREKKSQKIGEKKSAKL